MGIQLRNMKLPIFAVVLVLFVTDCCKGGVTKEDCENGCANMKGTDTCYYEESGGILSEGLCSSLVDDANARASRPSSSSVPPTGSSTSSPSVPPTGSSTSSSGPGGNSQKTRIS